MRLSPSNKAFLDARVAEFELIPAERKLVLDRLRDFIKAKHLAGEKVKLVVVCTHNSRRSHLGQAWAAAWGEYFGIATEAYSGGTEATACHPNTIAALVAQGWEIAATSEAPNPRYSARFSPEAASIHFWSKRFDDAANPPDGFAAIMVCSEADAACPFVPGAELRLSLPFTDPKASDGSGHEAEVYQQRSAEIAREIGYAFRSAVGGR